jgi:hypothetical protein
MGAEYSRTKNYGDIENFKYKLLVLAISDENGRPLFKDDEIELVKKFPAVVTDRLFEVAAALNGLDKKKSELDAEQAKLTDDKAVLDKHVPPLTTHPAFDQFKSMSLKALEPMSQGALTSDIIAAIQADLDKIK